VTQNGSPSSEDRIQALLDLEYEQRRYLEAVDEYLGIWPSSRISHHRNSLLDAIGRELVAVREAVARAEQRATEHEQRQSTFAGQQVQRQYDAHTLNMAAKLKMTPDQFLELQETRRRQAAGVKPIEEQLREAPVANP
jgi:hypothetical protein